MRKAAVLSCVCAGVLMVTCSNNPTDNGNGNDPPLTPTRLQVDARIMREISDISGYTSIEYYFSIEYDGVLTNGAVVSVNGVNIPRKVGFGDGYYDVREYETPTPNYVPGQDYTITILYNGETYTETLKAPGGITVNAEGTNIQWVENGTYATIDVAHVYGATTYYTPQTRPNPLTSPQVILSSAYPSADTYRIAIWLQNIKNNVGPLNGDKTLFLINDFRELRVTK
jgi:hypothetical protein